MTSFRCWIRKHTPTLEIKLWWELIVCVKTGVEVCSDKKCLGYVIEKRN